MTVSAEHSTHRLLMFEVYEAGQDYAAVGGGYPQALWTTLLATHRQPAHALALTTKESG